MSCHSSRRPGSSWATGCSQRTAACFHHFAFCSRSSRMFSVEGVIEFSQDEFAKICLIRAFAVPVESIICFLFGRVRARLRSKSSADANSREAQREIQVLLRLARQQRLRPRLP